MQQGIMHGRSGKIAALLALLLPQLASAAPLNDDGLHQQPWFLQSFLELEDDWQDADRAGRHFAVIWELRGCPSCRQLHESHFLNDAILDRLTTAFAMLQLNIIGSRRVTDFDGSQVAESELAKRYGVTGTPTIQVFARQRGDSQPAPREVLRIQGLPKADQFLGMLEYVRTGAYIQSSFESYWRRQASPELPRRPAS